MSRLNQFLQDFWLEMKRYDPLIALLADWNIVSRPADDSFQTRPYIRIFSLVTSLFLSIGCATMLNCNQPRATAPPPAVAVIVTLLIVTIPAEVFNFIWFRWVINRDTVKEKTKDASTAVKGMWYTRQATGVFFGFLVGIAMFVVGFCLFIVGIAATHNCSGTHKGNLIGDILLFQFTVNPVIMSLPYWREQSWMLSFLGQAGPAIGLLMHWKKYGFNPPPKDTTEDRSKEKQAAEKDPEAGTVTNPVVTVPN